MTLRISSLVYLIVVHVAFLALAAWQHDALGAWFFAVEAAVVASFLTGLWLLRRTLRPLDFLGSSADLLHDRAFSARLRPVGQPEMDHLIEVYNRMLTELYEERLRIGEQRGFLERFVMASPVGVVILDYDDRVTMVNPAAAEILGVAAEAALGSELGELPSELAPTLTSLEKGESQLIAWRSVRRLRLEKLAFVDRGFSRQFVLIEELTRVVNQSERAAYRKLIRLIAHEVNNTVAATNSLLGSCRTYAPQIASNDRGDYVEALDVAINRNEHLSRFVGDFAEVVRLPDPDPRPVDLVELTASLEPMFRAQAADRSIAVVRSGLRTAAMVTVDPEQIEQVLINVVKNAIEAIGTDGTVEISILRENGTVDLAVFDDGSGLSLEAEGEIFSPFFTTKPDGQGLGLTLVKEVLLNHEADFSLGTADDGRTRFVMRLPIR